MNALPTTPPQVHERSFAGFADVLRAEFCKLRSVRSTHWTIVAALAFNIAFAALEAIFLPGRLSAQDTATLDPVRVSLGGSHLSQIALGALGVLIITSEYTSGTIRATFSAVPRRRLLLAAKMAVFTVVTVVIGTAISFAAYFVFQGLLTGDTLQSNITDPGVVCALIGGGLYLTVLGLLGLGLGITLRSSTGAISALFALLFVPQILVQLLPSTWKSTIGRYVPLEAGNQIFSQHHEAGALSPWAGLGVLVLYATTALFTGLALITRRDV